jgi:hypothetical protein
MSQNHNPELPKKVFQDFVMSTLEEYNGVEGAALVTALFEYMTAGELETEQILVLLGGVQDMLTEVLVPSLSVEQQTKIINDVNDILTFSNEAVVILEEDGDLP